MNAQPDFKHPELVVYTIPQGNWVIGLEKEKRKTQAYLTIYHDRSSNFTRMVFENTKGEKVEETFYVRSVIFANISYDSAGCSTEEFFSGYTVRYRRKVGLDIREKWFDERGEKIASRKSRGGVLTCESDSPAVKIRRPFDLQREEFWRDGILEKVNVVDRKTLEKVMIQSWEGGVCVSQMILPSRQYQILEKDLALYSHAFRIVPAEKAREEFESDCNRKTLSFENEEAKIQRVLDDFEAQRRAGITRGERRFKLHMDRLIEKKVEHLLKEAGYSVDINDDAFWVSY